MRENLVGHLEVMDKMDSSQHGSRKGRSTLSQLLEHHDEIVSIMENGDNARWFLNFLSSRTQRVVVDGRTSSTFSVTSGMLEGTVLGPLLFLIYVSDIGDKVESMTKMYVDDAKVKKAIRSEEDVEELQVNLNHMYEWARTNNMKLTEVNFSW